MIEGLGSFDGASMAIGQDLSAGRVGARLDEAKALAEKVDGDPAELKKAALAFESLFASMLIKEMRATLAEGFFGSGPGADAYSGMLDEKIGETLGQQELFGVHQMLEAGVRARAAQTPEVK